MDECVIREAVLTDAAVIAHLVTQLGYLVSSREMEERLRDLFSRPEYTTLVAEISHEVVGMVGAYIGFAYEFTGTYGRLIGLAVDENWRGRGLGKLLMDSIKHRLREQGATVLILTSGKHRVKAHRFYRHLGYRETGLRFAKHLSVIC